MLGPWDKAYDVLGKTLATDGLNDLPDHLGCDAGRVEGTAACQLSHAPELVHLRQANEPLTRGIIWCPGVRNGNADPRPVDDKWMLEIQVVVKDKREERYPESRRVLHCVLRNCGCPLVSLGEDNQHAHSILRCRSRVLQAPNHRLQQP